MSGKAVRETLAALGVIASLVFVGIEIRQNTTVAKANARQALADQTISIQQLYAADEDISRQAWRWINWEGDPPEDLTGEFPRVVFLMTASLVQRENVFLQEADGIVGPSTLDSYGWSRGAPFQTALFETLWPAVRGQYHPDFVAAFEAEYDLAP